MLPGGPTRVRGSEVAPSSSHAFALAGASFGRALFLLPAFSQLATAHTRPSLYVFICLALASGVFLPMQRPWINKRKTISQDSWYQIGALSGAHALICLLTFHGLAMCGVFSVLLIECISLLAPAMARFRRGLSLSHATHLKAILVASLSLVLLFISLSDPTISDQRGHDIVTPESGEDTGLKLSSVEMTRILSGLAALIASVTLEHCLQARKLALGQIVGGQKRLHALLVPLAGLWLLFPALFSLFTTGTGLSLFGFFTTACVAFFALVLPYYVGMASAAHLKPHHTQQGKKPL